MRMNLTPAVKNLIIINVLVYLACFVFPDFLNRTLSGYSFSSPNFRPWQIVTHMFMHAQHYIDKSMVKHIEFTHILFNMYGLYVFGSAIENYLGTKRFLIYYFFCGIGAFFLHMGVSYFECFDFQNLAINYKISDSLFIPVVGASGAVMGVMIGFAILYPNAELMLLFPPIPIKAKYFVLIYGAIEFYMAMRQNPDDNVAHYAHLGGMLFGYLLLKYWQKNSKVW